MDPVPLVVFALVVSAVVLCVIRDVRIRTPACGCIPALAFSIDYALPPLLGVLVLLLSGSLPFAGVIKGGLTGDDAIQPYTIMILFNALAYVCISLDMTGCLAYVALLVAKKAGSSGK